MYAALLLTLFLAAQASPAAPPPDLTLPPETARVVLIVEGRGTQTYTCALEGSRYNWTFTAPAAQLFNLATGKLVGQHEAGPRWTLSDGSSVGATVLLKKPGDTPADIPWLLLSAQPAPNAAQGTLSPVTLVRRYNTHGGSAPPAGCDAEHRGNTVQVPYTATYAFYTQGPSLTRP